MKRLWLSTLLLVSATAAMAEPPPIVLAGFDRGVKPIWRKPIAGEEVIHLEVQFGLAIDHDESTTDDVLFEANVKTKKPKKVGIAYYFDTADYRLYKGHATMRLRQWWKDGDPKSPEFTVKARHSGERCNDYMDRTSYKRFESKAEADIFGYTRAVTAADLLPMVTCSITLNAGGHQNAVTRVLNYLFDSTDELTKKIIALQEAHVIPQNSEAAAEASALQSTVDRIAADLIDAYEEDQLDVINDHLSEQQTPAAVDRRELILVAASHIARWEIEDSISGITFQLDSVAGTYPTRTAPMYELSWKVAIPTAQENPDAVVTHAISTARRLMPGLRFIDTSDLIGKLQKKRN